MLTKKEIKKLIDVSSTRDTAIIYTMALTGMSQNEIRNFTIKKICRFCSSSHKSGNKQLRRIV
jgi:hypothetical protein